MFLNYTVIMHKKQMQNLTKEEIVNNRKIHTDKRKKIKENTVSKYKNAKKFNRLHWSELNF